MARKQMATMLASKNAKSDQASVKSKHVTNGNSNNREGMNTSKTLARMRVNKKEGK